jgi:hypothetical protein
MGTFFSLWFVMVSSCGVQHVELLVRLIILKFITIETLLYLIELGRT